MDQERRGIGARRRGNPNHPQQGQNQQAQPQPLEAQQKQEEDPKGEFGDYSVIQKDWRNIAGLTGPVLNKKKKAICWSIVFARLLQAIYNKDKDRTQRLVFVIDDLVRHIKENGKFELANLKKAIKFIAETGLLKESVGTSKASKQGKRVKAKFHINENANDEFIRRKVDESVVAILLDVSPEFLRLKGEIYNVRAMPADPEVEGLKHCLIIVAYGRTRDGRLLGAWMDARIFFDGTCPVIYGEL